MSSPSFEFAVSGTSFTVVSFEGSEALSKLYEYVIEVKISTESTASATFLDDVLDGDPEFKIIYGSDEYPVYGMLADFTENFTAGDYTYYTATLVPRLWQLTLNRNSKVYNDPSEETVVEILASMLDKCSLDYAVGDITGDLLVRDYRCQFNETDFDFISRLLENEGIFYYFDHSSGYDEIVFSNSNGDAFDSFAADSDVTFDASPPASTLYDSICSWSCRKKRLPANLAMESYSPVTPSTNPSGDFAISTTLIGEQYIFGEHIQDDDEGDYLAQIRAEEFAVNTTKYYGQSGVCGLRSGYSFKLMDHPNNAYNKETDYTIIEVTHRGTFLDGSSAVTGSSSSSISRIGGGGSGGGSGVGGGGGGGGSGGIQSVISGTSSGSSASSPLYENSFVAIDDTKQYRPARVTPNPKFHGMLTAVIHSDTKGDYAEIDEQGRYRVLLPFRANTSLKDSERVSHWIRMSQPYMGGITKNESWEAEGVFYPLMDNTEVLLTFINGDPDRPIITGAVPNALVPPLLDSTNSNQTVFSTHGMSVEEIRGGTRKVILSNNWPKLSYHDDGVTPQNFEFSLYNQTAEDGGGTRFTNLNESLNLNDGNHHIKMFYGDEYNYREGNTYNWGADFTIGFGNDYEEVHESEEQIAGEHFNMTEAMQSLGNTLKKYDYKTETEVAYDYSDWEDGQDGLTEKSWGDKCEYHFGRAFNWSGGTGPGGSLQTYNYGNGYTENLLEHSGGTAETNGISSPHDSYSSFGIDPEKSTIEKTFGDTYSYQDGFSAEVKVGDSKSEVHGDSNSQVYGNSIEIVHGTADNKVMGATSDMFLGAKNEMNLNVSNEMTLGLASELFIGGKIETTLAAILEFGAGIKLSANATAEFELKIVDGGVSVLKADADVTELQTKVTLLETSATTITNTATAITNTAAAIQATGVDVSNNGLTMIN